MSSQFLQPYDLPWNLQSNIYFVFWAVQRPHTHRTIQKRLPKYSLPPYLFPTIASLWCREETKQISKCLMQHPWHNLCLQNYSCSITGIWQQVPNALLFPPFLWVTSPSWERQRHKMRTGVFPDDQIFLESSLVSSQRAFTRNFTQKYIDSLASGGKIYGIINARAPGLSMKVFSGHASAAKYAV